MCKFKDTTLGIKKLDFGVKRGAMAVFLTDGGGFADPNGTGNGGTPIGIVINQGKIVWGNAGSTYEVIGFDNDNKLVVGSMTGQQAIDRGVRESVTWMW